MFNIIINHNIYLFIIVKMLLTLIIIYIYVHVFKINEYNSKQLTAFSIIILNFILTIICINNLYWVVL